MVSFVILLLLFIGAYAGYRRGIIIQLLQTIGYVLVFIPALDYYQWVSDFLYLLVPYITPFAPESNPYLFYDEQFILTMDRSYYDLLAFLLILLIGWVVVRFVVQFFSYTLENIPIPEPFRGLGGAVLGVAVNYVGIFFLLFFLTTIPLEGIQNRLMDSSLSRSVIQSSPVLSEDSYERFIVNVHEEALENQPLMQIEPPVEIPVDEAEEAEEESSE